MGTIEEGRWECGFGNYCLQLALLGGDRKKSSIDAQMISFNIILVSDLYYCDWCVGVKNIHWPQY